MVLKKLISEESEVLEASLYDLAAEMDTNVISSCKPAFNVEDFKILTQRHIEFEDNRHIIYDLRKLAFIDEGAFNVILGLSYNPNKEIIFIVKKKASIAEYFIAFEKYAKYLKFVYSEKEAKELLSAIVN